MKRISTVLLFAAFLALILASCAADPSAEAPSPLPAAEPPSVPSPIPSPIPPPVPSPVPPPEPSPEPPEEPPITRDPYSITYDKTIAGFEFFIIENELIRIYLPRDADIPPDIEAMVMQCIIWVEDAAGTDMLTNTSHHFRYHNNPIMSETALEAWFSGMNAQSRLMNAPWMDNSNHATDDIRLGIYLFKELIGMADPTGIYIGLDYFQDSSGAYDSVAFGVIIHELAHVAFLRAMDSFGGWFYNRPLLEGHAEWATVKIAREQGFPIMLDDWLGQLRLSHINDIADYFTTGWAADHRDNPGTLRPYQYGYVFLSFLDEVYGADILSGMYKEIDRASYTVPSDVNSDEASYKANTHNSKIKVEIIKKHTSEDVFDDCIKWFADNKDRIYS
jgi:hypothetical protein